MLRRFCVIAAVTGALFGPVPAVAQEVGPVLIIIEDVEGTPDTEDTTVATEPRGPVTYAAPLLGGDPWVAGKSIKELITGTPRFPPIEGLPDEVWKDKICSDCHAWEVENVCEQAEFYLPEDRAERLGKPHPYGGSFKVNLRIWALAGCPE
ncbi:hypothetical protein IV417_08770 [Alphaproteobacteria bacterium KMM 3653]|uniref:Uncharacterized protein n=1 Tax=Harenicola maris TaxID=2841044 RepID=A0AAP2G439_9RHOB|nr:hypothetical protein [Harenicola maris]